MDIQVQGKDRLYVKYIADQLGLGGSYVPRTYIEQIQLEKLVNDVMVWDLCLIIHFSHFALPWSNQPIGIARWSEDKA